MYPLCAINYTENFNMYCYSKYFPLTGISIVLFRLTYENSADLDQTPQNARVV